MITPGALAAGAYPGEVHCCRSSRRTEAPAGPLPPPPPRLPAASRSSSRPPLPAAARRWCRGCAPPGSPPRNSGVAAAAAASASVLLGDRASPRVGGAWRGEHMKTQLVKKVTLKKIYYKHLYRSQVPATVAVKIL